MIGAAISTTSNAFALYWWSFAVDALNYANASSKLQVVNGSIGTAVKILAYAVEFDDSQAVTQLNSYVLMLG